MSKNKRRGGDGGGGGESDMKREQKLQAILLADSFTRTFRPVTWESPKVLLPLVNVPMLEYTIEFLAQNGVEELFVVCVWHAEMLQKYVNNSRWSATIAVRCIDMGTSCLSAGDALRELDSQGLIRSDPFILISGDVISNMDLKKAIAFHKEKKKEDNSAIMTVVLKSVQKGAGAKPVVDDLVVAFDQRTGQILLFEDAYKKKDVRIPLEILAEHPGLQLRTDLLDCHVDICSPELMLQFSDNFDYQDIRRDFIRNEAVNWELGMHIYSYTLQNEYAARVHDPRTYHSICRDIVTRWVHPLVPDAQLLKDDNYTSGTKGSRYVYKDKGDPANGVEGVRISRTASIGEGVVLGRGSIVEDNVSLNRTIVGRGCTIGQGAVISESHLWARAVVESGAQITQAIVCDGAVIKRNACIKRGCIISYGVVVGEGVVIPEYTRISLKKCIDGDEDELVSTGPKYDTEVLGPDGRGYLWAYNKDDENDDGEDEDEEEVGGGFVGKVDTLKAHSLGCREEEQWKKSLWRIMPEPAKEEDSEGDEEDETLDFGKIVGEMISTGRAEGHPAENLLMEIKGYKFAQNKTFSACLQAVIPEILVLCVSEGASGGNASSTQKQIVLSMQGLLSVGNFGHVILKALIQDVRDELVVVETLEEEITKEKYATTLYPIFRFALQILYDSELVSEETLLTWIESRRDEAEDAQEDGEEASLRVKLFNQPSVKAFVEWLESEGDEDDSEDEDDDDA